VETFNGTKKNLLPGLFYFFFVGFGWIAPFGFGSNMLAI
jgi:hypothetical protein